MKSPIPARILQYNAPNAGNAWPKRITNVAVHWTGTVGQTANTTAEATRKMLDSINQFHQTKDWGDGARAPKIVYHFAVDLVGRIYQLNSINDISWHAGEANGFSVGVLVLQGADHVMSREELRNVFHAFDHIETKLIYPNLGLLKSDWKPHNHWRNTTCCGDQLKSELAYWARERTRETPS